MRRKSEEHSPAVLKADEGPLNVEHVVTDNIWLAVLHQKLKVVHSLLELVIIQNVADETEVYIRCKTENGNSCNFI